VNRWKTALIGAIALGPFSLANPAAEDNVKEDRDRLHSAGTAVQEILDIPDDIPQDLMDMARCAVVLPSVIKAAFIAGGSYGRGVTACCTRKDFNGPWALRRCMRWQVAVLDYRSAEK
jgi:SH3 domain-containing YSC84-like protein 1